MNKILQFTCVMMFFSSHPSYALSLKESTLERLIESYQDRSLALFGMPIVFQIQESKGIQAYGGHIRGKALIVIYRGVLEVFDLNSLIGVVCHELGHLFGEIPLNVTGTSIRGDGRNSVEGEADYFAGKCLKENSNLLIGNASGLSVIHTLFQKLTNVYDLDVKVAKDDFYLEHKGIDPHYPNPSCRLLSAINGFKGMPRPSCWYNPF